MTLRDLIQLSKTRPGYDLGDRVELAYATELDSAIADRFAKYGTARVEGFETWGATHYARVRFQSNEGTYGVLASRLRKPVPEDAELVAIVAAMLLD